MNAIEELEADALERAIAEETRTLVVDFWSPWCAPCRTLRPHLATLAEGRESEVRLVALNVDAEKALAEALQVRSLPTVSIFRGGKERQRFTGAAMLGEVRRALETIG